MLLLSEACFIFLMLIVIVVWRWSYIIGITTSGSSTLRCRRVHNCVWSILRAVSWCIILWAIVLIEGFMEVFRTLEKALNINLEVLIFFLFKSNLKRTSLWIIVAIRCCSGHYHWRSGSYLSNLSSFRANKFGFLALSGSTWEWFPLINVPVNARRSDTLCWAIILVRSDHLLIIAKELFMNIKITKEWMLLFTL